MREAARGILHRRDAAGVTLGTLDGCRVGAEGRQRGAVGLEVLGAAVLEGVALRRGVGSSASTE